MKSETLILAGVFSLKIDIDINTISMNKSKTQKVANPNLDPRWGILTQNVTSTLHPFDQQKMDKNIAEKVRVCL